MAKRRTKKEGSIWKDKKKWRAAIFVDGKRITRNFDTKTECSSWIREMQSQIDRGMTYRKSSINLSTFIQQWLEVHKTKLAPKTTPRYEQLIRDYILPQLGNIKLRDLRLDKIEAHYIALLEGGLSPRSVRFVHSILHKCLNDAIRRGYIGYNAAQGATQPRSEPKEIFILDEDEALRFLITVRGHPQEALYHLAIKTGLRKGELLALKWSDLDWKKGTILIQRQVQRIQGQGIIFRPPKTRAGRRTIQLGEQTLIMLRHQLGRCTSLKDAAGRNWQEYDLIFPSKVGTPIGGSNIIRCFKSQIAKAGIKTIRFHDLRHTAASLMLNNGIPVLVVSKILGHSKTSTTLDIYGHLIPVMQEEAARIMDEVVTPIQVDLGEKIEFQSSN